MSGKVHRAVGRRFCHSAYLHSLSLRSANNTLLFFYFSVCVFGYILFFSVCHSSLFFLELRIIIIFFCLFPLLLFLIIIIISFPLGYQTLLELPILHVLLAELIPF
eukprot:gene11401-7906_t